VADPPRQRDNNCPYASTETPGKNEVGYEKRTTSNNVSCFGYGRFAAICFC
jgi:hypothetical protein